MQTTEKKYEFGPRGPQRQEPARPAPQAKAYAGNGPLKNFRSGALNVAIWENESLSPEGQVQSYKTVSFERRYKDKVSGEWKTSNSLRINDLPKAALLLNKAYEYLVLTGEDNDEIDA